MDTFLESILKYDGLTEDVIQELVDLSNDASGEEVYGESLYQKLIELSEGDYGFANDDVDRLYLLSVYQSDKITYKAWKSFLHT